MSVLGAHFFNAYRQSTRPDAARPHGLALYAFFSIFVMHFFLCSFFCFSFAYLLGTYFFNAYFSAFLFGFVGREAAVCTAGKSPETRINKGFARALYF